MRTACDDRLEIYLGRQLARLAVVRLGASVTGRTEHDLRTALGGSATIISVASGLPAPTETAVSGVLPRTHAGHLYFVNDDAIDGHDLLAVLADISPRRRRGDADRHRQPDRSVARSPGWAAPRMSTSDSTMSRPGLCELVALVRPCRARWLRRPPGPRRGNRAKRPPYATGDMLAARSGPARRSPSRPTSPSTRNATVRDVVLPRNLVRGRHRRPDLPEAQLDAALLGLGAVGMAVVVLLAGLNRRLATGRRPTAVRGRERRHLPTRHRADAAAENHKVDLAAEVSDAHFVIYEHRGDIADLPAPSTPTSSPGP